MQKRSNVMGQVFLSLCEQVDTPKSLGAWLRYKHCREAVPEIKFQPRDYTEKEITAAQGDYLVASFLKKYKKLDTKVDTAAVALAGFDLCEERNQKTNVALRSGAPGSTLVEAVLFTASRKISALLGPFSVFCIEPYFDWGPGATHDLPRRVAHPDLKMIATPMTVSRTAAAMLHNVITRDLHWSYALLGTFPEGDWSMLPSLFSETNTCKVVTVPKDATKDRTIAIEATGNLFLQKGFGGYIRRALRKVGIDLDNQEVNQNLARHARSLGLATLDLKDASNSIVTELVYQLLPYDWAASMDAVRSRWALMPDGSSRRLEMFSSMGNGFTFELESMIFWALGSALKEVTDTKGPFSVYGDDIIISSSLAGSLTAVLEHCGFIVNETKSFVDGLFFESCGKHYFMDVDITPAYQKEELTSVEFVRCHNRLFRWSERAGFRLKALRVLRHEAPPDLTSCNIPQGVEGDDGFLTDFSGGFDAFAFCAFDKNHGIECHVFRGKVRSLNGDHPAFLARHFRSRRHDTTEVDAPVRTEILAGLPTYGMVTLPDSSPGNGWSFGTRWIYPPGVCIC